MCTIRLNPANEAAKRRNTQECCALIPMFFHGLFSFLRGLPGLWNRIGARFGKLLNQPHRECNLMDSCSAAAVCVVHPRVMILEPPPCLHYRMRWHGTVKRIHASRMFVMHQSVMQQLSQSIHSCGFVGIRASLAGFCRFRHPLCAYDIRSRQRAKICTQARP